MKINAQSIALLAVVAFSPVFVASVLAQESSRMTGFKLDGDQPIQIESDQLEVREADSVAIFVGNVSVVQGPTLMRSGKMTVYYNNNGGSPTSGSADIDRLEVEGKVYVRSQDQIATGDRGNFDMKTETLVLTGKEVVLSEGENVIVGCKLTVHAATGQARLEGCRDESSPGNNGRVRMLLKPGSQGQ